MVRKFNDQTNCIKYISRSLTYSLLVRDVQLGFSVRLELVLFKSCIDPSILHDLLQMQSDTLRAQLIPDL